MACGCGGCGGEHLNIRGSIGEELFTLPVRITELTGTDISGDPVDGSVGARDTPGTWVPVTSPHRVAVGTILAGDFRRANPQYSVDVPDATVLYWVEIRMFIGAAGINDLTPGADYWPWMQLTDNPQIPIGRGDAFYYS